MVDHILEIAVNGLAWARRREAERLDSDDLGVVEWGPGDQNDERYLVEELAEPLPTQLSIIRTIIRLQTGQDGSDEENVSRFRELFMAGQITNEFVFTLVAACSDFYAFGWMARHIAGLPPFRHYCPAGHTASSLVDPDREVEKAAVAR
jgi:hypothetical protein